MYSKLPSVDLKQASQDTKGCDSSAVRTYSRPFRSFCTADDLNFG
jgi:hypothetical protein